MPTFRDDHDRRAFLAVVEALVERGALEVHAFCLMPNHYHLLLRTPQGALARWMRYVNGDYARGFNRRHRRVGHLWQGRYKAILVQTGTYYLECSRYIHLNPNRAKLTRPAERYRWSSYRNYVGGQPVAPWVETELLLAEFGGDRQRCRAFVEAGRGERQVSPFERAVAGLALGSEAYLDQLRALVEGREATEDQPALANLRRAGQAAPEAVEAAVEQVFAHMRPRNRQRLLLYAQRRHSLLRSADVARRYGRTRGAVTLAARAVDASAGRDPELADGLARLRELLVEGGYAK